MCGIPGSGKTYFCKDVLMKHPWRSRVYISSDDIREKVCGDASDQSCNEIVFGIFYARAREAVENGDDVILDATHISKKTRRKCRSHFKGLDCQFVAVELTTPVEKAVRRNKNRDRVVPDYAMNRMIQNYEPVGDDEGFDGIWRV
jgi:predicted kinase